MVLNLLRYAAIGVYRMQQLLDVADIIGAMSLEGVLGSASPFSKKLHQIRPFIGCKHVAHRLRCITGTFRNDTITH